MSARGLLLLERDEGFVCCALGRQANDEVVATDNPSEVAAAASRFVSMHRLGTQTVVALASSSVFFVRLDVDPVESRDRVSLTFGLEDSLPLDAEQIVADFDLRDPASAVAVDADRFVELVDELEAAGLRVQSIVPAVALLVSGLSKQSERLLWRSSRDRCDLVDRTGTRVVGWRDVAMNQLNAVLAIDRTDQPLIAMGFNDAITNDAIPNDAIPNNATRSDVDPMSIVRHQAGRLLRGALTPQYELRRDRLNAGDPYRAVASTLGWTAVAVLLFTASVAGLLFLKTQDIRQDTAELKQEKRELFERALPEADSSRLIMTRLRREHVKLLGSRQVDPDVPETVAALNVLHSFLSGRVESVRSRVIDLRIENAELRVDIEVNEHDDAARLAEGLEAAGFVMDSPATIQRDDGTIISTLRGDWIGSPSDEVAANGERS